MEIEVKVEDTAVVVGMVRSVMVVVVLVARQVQ